MRTEIGCVALLLGAMGIVTCAAASENAAGVAEKRGLSPIIITPFTLQGAELFGPYHGVAVHILKGKGDGKNIVVKMENPKQISIDTHEFPKLFKVEDINNDKVLEAWAERYDGEQMTTYLYQIDLQRMQKAIGKKATIKPSLIVASDSDNPFQNIKLKDMDGDGLVELLVMTPTHPLYGTLYSAGEIEWTDIYQLTPMIKQANVKFKPFYLRLSEEIKQEVQKTHSRINDLEKKIQGESEDSDLKTVYEIKIREANDQISVYQAWLQKIKKIAGIAQKGIIGKE